MRYLRHLTGLALVLTLVIGCGSDDKADSSKDPADSYRVETNQAGGNVTLDPQAIFALTDLDGTLRQSSEWIGKRPVVLNFWGTWCPPCRKEIPELVKLYEEYKDRNVEIIGIALERRAGPEQVKQFVQQSGMDWVVVMGTQEIAQAYQINSVPTLVFYDAQGRLVNQYIGLQSAEMIREGFESII